MLGMATSLAMLTAATSTHSHRVTARTTNAVMLQNPMQLFDTTGARMNVHDGDVRQWTPDGPYYYYGMCASIIYSPHSRLRQSKATE